MISVITATWQRHDLLFARCLPSVAKQRTGNTFEHIVVSDGPDETLRARLGRSVRYSELDQHDPCVNWGVSARIHGEQMARGDFICHVDDDDVIYPQHLSVLYSALDVTGADFAYSQMRMIYPSGATVTLGQDPPIYGQIGISFLYRRELSKVATWRTGSQTIDWDLVDRWMKAGATWVYVPEVTIDCYPSSLWSPQ